MEEDLFIKYFSNLPIQERLKIAELEKDHPGLFSFLQQNFYDKVEALEKKDKEAMAKIYEAEKNKIHQILAQAIKEDK